MPSVFPGVDPYLESQGFWQDFHTRFITYWADLLAECLPDNYEARIEENLRLVEIQPDEETSKLVGADVAVERRGLPGAATALLPAPAGAAVLEAVSIPLPLVAEECERSIRILHRPERSLVAVLELLSPWNKEEPGYSAYVHKRNAILRQPVHLVEVDLLRGGRRPPLRGVYPPGDYFALIAHAEQRPNASVVTWNIRQRLPALSIPLSAPDASVWVDLAVLFNQAYDRGRYSKALDYSIAPTAIDDADRDWAQQLLRSGQSANGSP